MQMGLLMGGMCGGVWRFFIRFWLSPTSLRRAPAAGARPLTGNPHRTNTRALLMFQRMQKLPLFIFAAVVAWFLTTALKAQTLKFADESFSLSAKAADVEKVENDYLTNGKTETNWTQKLV